MGGRECGAGTSLASLGVTLDPQACLVPSAPLLTLMVRETSCPQGSTHLLIH